jgi:hypothetical protein
MAGFGQVREKIGSAMMSVEPGSQRRLGWLGFGLLARGANRATTFSMGGRPPDRSHNLAAEAIRRALVADDSELHSVGSDGRKYRSATRLCKTGARKAMRHGIASAFKRFLPADTKKP